MMGFGLDDNTKPFSYVIRGGEAGGVLSVELSETRSCLDNEARRINSWILDTRDAIIREQLIKLGWTPPVDATTTS
jgi:hypothetical protein